MVDHIRAVHEKGRRRLGRWCNMASDMSVADLHKAAKGIGVSRIWFKRGTYAIRADERTKAVAAGAEEVTAQALYARMARKSNPGRIR